MKPNKNDLSINASIGVGYKNKYYYNFDILNIAKRNKNFSTFQYNSIGINNSQYDFLTNTSLYNLKNTSFYLDQLLYIPFTFFEC